MAGIISERGRLHFFPKTSQVQEVKKEMQESGEDKELKHER